MLFVGLAPSSRNEDPNIPFKGTRSFQRLERWIRSANVGSYALTNLFTYILPKEGLKLDELKEAANKLRPMVWQFDGVVALGHDVSRALKAAGIEHYRLPHPSARNRLFNNKGYEPALMLKFKAWVDANEPEKFI